MVNKKEDTYMKKMTTDEMATALQKWDNEQQALKGAKPRKLKAAPAAAALLSGGLGLGPGATLGSLIGGGAAHMLDAQAGTRAKAAVGGALAGGVLGSTLAAILAYKTTKELGYALSRGAVE